LEEQQEIAKDFDKQMEGISEEWKKWQKERNSDYNRWKEARNKIDRVQKTKPKVDKLLDQRRIIEKSCDSKLAEKRTDLLNQLRELLSSDPASTDQEVRNEALSIPKTLKDLPSRINEQSKDIESFDDEVLKPQRERVQESKNAGEEAEKLQPMIAEDRAKIGELQMIRSSMREIQPLVRRSFVTRITESANDYLRRLYHGSELEGFELTEDYEFMVTRAGYKRHARRLSGGQQVLVSMAFLLALSEVLSRLDFLVLDEPTTHLDEGRRRELVNVLENLRRVPQLVIVDHHPELLGAADTRFEVILTPEGFSRVEENIS
jgi:exonuclease SbcC